MVSVSLLSALAGSAIATVEAAKNKATAVLVSMMINHKRRGKKHLNNAIGSSVQWVSGSW